MWIAFLQLCRKKGWRRHQPLSEIDLLVAGSLVRSRAFSSRVRPLAFAFALAFALSSSFVPSRLTSTFGVIQTD